MSWVISNTRAHYEYYSELLDAYPEYQLCLVDEGADYPVAVRIASRSLAQALMTCPQRVGIGWWRALLALGERDSICSARSPFRCLPSNGPKAMRG